MRGKNPNPNPNPNQDMNIDKYYYDLNVFVASAGGAHTCYIYSLTKHLVLSNYKYFTNNNNNRDEE